jgi:riboflavin kinase/FMN adenylyltransferase
VHRLIERSTIGVTIGNFDGLHLGHQALFDELDRTLKVRAAEGGKPAAKVLLSFRPHPRQVLQGLRRADVPAHPEFFTLTSVRQKLSLLERWGFAFCYLLRFSKQFSAIEPEEFLERFLLKPLRPCVVVIGDDWAFGKGRAGNAAMLAEFGKEHGFEVKVVSSVLLGGSRISSTSVKQALAAADFALLRTLLGRPYVLEGRVRHGERRGRNLGFPTANLEFRALLLPPDGIYATFAELQGRKIPAVTYIGDRPTFATGRRVVEVHLLDGGRYDIYGERLEVEFLQRLRGDREFSNEKDLVQAIQSDIAVARRILQQQKK